MTVGSSWSADTGIYGTSQHFGPPSFICGIGYDLRYRGRIPLQSVDVSVRYPPAFVSIAKGEPFVSGDWIRPTLPIDVNGHSVADEAARAGHVAGSVGSICPDGAGDLESLRGALVRVRWRDGTGDHEEQFTVYRIRELIRVYGGDASTDWQPRMDWR